MPILSLQSGQNNGRQYKMNVLTYSFKLLWIICVIYSEVTYIVKYNVAYLEPLF